LSKAVPSSTALLIEAAGRNYNLGSITSSLLRLLDRYGATELEVGIVEALKRDVPHPNAVRISLERRREERDQLPPVSMILPDDERVRNLVIRTPNLNIYDQLQSPLTENTHDD